VGLTFVGADPEAISVATESLPGRSHYLLGNDPAKWITDLPHYAGIQYSEIFPNIDLVYYGKDGHLEFDLVVHPGARLEGVILKFDGAASLALDAQGDLIIAVGDLQLVLHRPMAYQIKGTEKEPVQARFVLLSPGEVGFSLGAHDPGRTVVIDPVLSYSTYVGGSSFDFATAIAVDSSGNIFVAGKTDSSDFPGTALSNTPSLSRAFVRKYDPAGNLVFSSYFGGIDLGAVTDLEVTAAGSPIITGFTATGNFPVVNALQPTFRGPYDAFITKLEPSGSAFVFSTFLGGDSLEQAWGLALDSSENIYVVGDTRSENFPVTAGVFQSANAGGQDTFVSKINASGSALVYSTYFGASGGEFAGDIAVDASGNAYITGDTNSLDFPTKNAFQPTCRSCPSHTDAFVAKLSATGASLVYSTHLGGTVSESAFGIDVDSGGHAYVTGRTVSGDFPTTPGSLQPASAVFAAGGEEAFVTKLSPSGSSLIYSTFLGGDFHDFGRRIVVDSLGTAYVAGTTSSVAFPAANPLPGSCGVCSGLGSDAFVSRLNADGSALLFSTWLGGSIGVPNPGGGLYNAVDTGAALAVDPVGNIYLAGQTLSANFPIQGASQATSGGLDDGFVATIRPQIELNPGLLVFPNQAVGVPSAPRSVEVLNRTAAPVSVTAIMPGSGNTADFSLEADNCSGQTLNAEQGCSFALSFIPGATNLRKAEFLIQHSAAAGTSVLNLSGTGGFPILDVSPGSLTFSDHAIGTTSAPQQVTLTLLNDVTLIFAGVETTGDFQHNRICSNSLGTGGSCLVEVAFSPTGEGLRTGSLLIHDNSQSSPHTILLTGTGLPGPAASVSTGNLAFGNLAVGTTSLSQVVTFTNIGTTALNISGITISGDFSQTNTCQTALQPSSSCTAQVTFTPMAIELRNGTLTFTSNAPGSPHAVSLQGRGVDFQVALPPGSPNSVTLNAGQTATFNLSFVGSTGFASNLNLTCSGAPPFGNCTINPGSVSVVNTTPASATVSVTTRAPSNAAGSLAVFPGAGGSAAWALLVVLLAMGWMASRAAAQLRPLPARQSWSLRATLLLALLFAACGGGGGGSSNPPPSIPGTPAGSYTVTVTATPSFGNTHTITLTVVVR